MFSSKMYICTNKPSKVLFALTKLIMTNEVPRIDGIVLIVELGTGSSDLGILRLAVISK
jgi:hypothetical protein